MVESIYDRINDYGSVKIGLASPNDIRSWSFGEVRKPETINYRTYRPEKDGLFCERIFGPERDWECACGKYKGTKFKGIICDRCGVKVTHSRVRRKRMGHINLAAPVVHIWFFKAMPSRLANILNMKTSDIEKIVYFQDYVVSDPGPTQLKRGQLLTEDEYRRALDTHGETFAAEMGAEAIRSLLKEIDLDKEVIKLRQDLDKTNSQQKSKEISKRLKIIESLRQSDNDPEWMVMDVIPVIPPDLRPLVLLESGNFATSDLNDLYRRIINRNNRLKKLVDLNAPEVIIRNEKRMLQQAVDALFDNGRCRRPVLGSSNRPLKSLTDMIKGKQGRFRENLLGKRVDYSARSVIVVGPELHLYQCGLPKKIALELYQPFIIRQLKERGITDTIKSAKKMLERKEDCVWDVLEDVIREHPVLLNRAPTLHRMGIQAFEPVLIEGNAIQLHPLVCRGFNADFDGDQMAVHLPLSVEAQIEAHVLMMSSRNIFSPANGSPIMSPSQDIVLGNYYITLCRSGEKGEGMAFSSPYEAMLAYEQGKVSLHAGVKVRLPDNKRAVDADANLSNYGAVIESTVGRCIFNDPLSDRMPFYNYALGNKGLSRVISDCFEFSGRSDTVDLLDTIKDMGFKYATLAGLSISVTDLRIPEKKQEIINETQKRVDRIEKNFKIGALTEGERKNQIIDAWTHARVQVTNEMMKGLESDTRDGKLYLNPVFLMTESGARGRVDQIQQLAGMRALMAKPSGEIIETPIKSNFREGLNVLEYFSSTHGARKGLADTALKTADSGYLTRKLADVCQNVIVNEYDCGTLQGINKSAIYQGEQVSIPLRNIIIGRVARDTIRNPITDEIIVSENDVITPDIAGKIEDIGLETISVRSPMTCESPLGVCGCCYGWDLSTGRMVEQGLAVGIIAAQSIGEPGTQLTMRTFHTGGIAERAVMEHLTRATEEGTIKYFELNAVDVPQDDGSVKTIALKRNGEILILDDKDRELERYRVPYGSTVLVREGEHVKHKTVMFEWDPHSVPILSEASGIIRFQDIEEGETIRTEIEAGGKVKRPVVIEHKGEKHPRVVIEDTEGRILDFHYLPAKARIQVEEGQEIPAGWLLALQPRAIAGTQDITGGLPRVTEVFEARKPKEPAAMAEISGRVELTSDKRRGKMTIIVKSEAEGMQPVDHHVPHDKHLLVHSGDYVEAGDPLTDGPLIPHDILRIRGEEALQVYLLLEIQNVYQAQKQNINDKHIEIVIAQMLRKVKVENAGDTNLLPGDTVDKFIFRQENERIANSIKINETGDSDLKVGQILTKDELTRINEPISAIGGDLAVGKKCRPATATTMLLGITKASLQSESFVSAASFQETTRVLTEASISGKVDQLLGLKENVILGHLIPAGTAFKPYLGIKVKHAAKPPLPVEVEAKELLEVEDEETRAEKAVKEALGLTD
ncbi:MAG: DNA-directed RNA polymerase subunit beta' [Sedimentisphaerales bacterium]|nr:DNA-directed RNA polymerase subunit beta' [Sedimentisphaerales bacterium]